MGRREASAICGIRHNLALQRTLGAMIHSVSLWQGVGVGVGTVANFPGLRRIALLDGFDMSVVEWRNSSNAQSHSQVQDGCFELLIRSWQTVLPRARFFRSHFWSRHALPIYTRSTSPCFASSAAACAPNRPVTPTTPVQQQASKLGAQAPVALLHKPTQAMVAARQQHK